MSENYNKSIKKFYSSWMDYVYNWNQLYIRYNANLSDSISKAFNENNASFASLVSEDMRNKIRKSFDKNFRKEMKDEGFINSLSKTMDSWFALSDYYGINKSYQIFIDLFSSWNKILEPLRDSLNRTESEIIPMNGRYHLLHYKSNKENHKKT
ncbi:MAG: hypothetical protein ACE5RE_04105, partial [Candidatus Nitrosomaritimum aestuariumsis]